VAKARHWAKKAANRFANSSPQAARLSDSELIVSNEEEAGERR
jgi:hypothetical protein